MMIFLFSRYKYLFGCLVFISVFFLFSLARAATGAGVVYPVASLGGCENEEACYNYCAESENYSSCTAFAKENGLLSEEKVQQVELMNDAISGGNGPGECDSGSSCESYCNEVTNLRECVDFAETVGFIDDEKLQKGRQINNTIDQGVSMPGGCMNKDECDVYCSNTDHMEECLAFAEASGFMPPEELDKMKQILPLMREGKSPGGCKMKDQCDSYCSDELHFGECTDFAVQAGFMSEKEAEMMKTNGGKGPGGCKNQIECDQFCQEIENADACVNYAIEYGLMTEEEAKNIRQRGFSGPGGCMNEKECDSFCSQPDNQDTCLEFAIEKGMVSPDELERITNDFQGPGGCIGEEACQSYCSDEANMEECSRFMGHDEGGQFDKPDNFFSMPAAGPGGCSSPEECMRFCGDLSNTQECQKFVNPDMRTIDDARKDVDENMINEVKTFEDMPIEDQIDFMQIDDFMMPPPLNMPGTMPSEQPKNFIVPPMMNNDQMMPEGFPDFNDAGDEYFDIYNNLDSNTNGSMPYNEQGGFMAPGEEYQRPFSLPQDMGIPNGTGNIDVPEFFGTPGNSGGMNAPEVFERPEQQAPITEGIKEAPEAGQVVPQKGIIIRTFESVLKFLQI